MRKNYGAADANAFLKEKFRKGAAIVNFLLDVGSIKKQNRSRLRFDFLDQTFRVAERNATGMLQTRQIHTLG